MQETKKISWSRVLRTVLSLTLVMALLLCCGCGKENEQPTTNPNALGDGDGKLEAHDVVEGITKLYGTALGAMGGQTATSAGSEMDISLTLGDDILSYLSGMMETYGLPTDVSWLKQIGIGMDISYQGDLTQADLALSLGETSVISAQMIVDMLGSMMYVAVPELNDQYLGATIDMDSTTGSSEMMDYAGIIGALPTEAELNTLLTRYLNIMLEKLEDPTTSEDTITFGGISQPVTATTHTIRAAQLLEMMENVLTTAQTDAELEKMLDAISKFVNEQGAAEAAANGTVWENQDLHQDMLEAIPEALVDLAEAKTDLTDSDYLTLSTYNAEGMTVGIRLTVFDKEESQEIYAYYLTSGENTAFILNAVDQFRFEGTGTTVDGKANGTYKLYLEEMETATVEVKDFNVKALEKGELDGTLRLRLTDDAIEELMGPSMFFTSATVLEMQMKTEGSNASVTYNLYSGSAFVLGMTVTSKTVSSGQIQVPAEYADLQKSEELAEWTSGVDFNQILQNLRNAGAPEELVALLEAGLGI